MPASHVFSASMPAYSSPNPEAVPHSRQEKENTHPNPEPPKEIVELEGELQGHSLRQAWTSPSLKLTLYSLY